MTVRVGSSSREGCGSVLSSGENEDDRAGVQALGWAKCAGSRSCLEAAAGFINAVLLGATPPPCVKLLARPSLRTVFCQQLFSLARLVSAAPGHRPLQQLWWGPWRPLWPG